MSICGQSEQNDMAADSSKVQLERHERRFTPCFYALFSTITPRKDFTDLGTYANDLYAPGGALDVIGEAAQPIALRECREMWHQWRDDQKLGNGAHRALLSAAVAALNNHAKCRHISIAQIRMRQAGHPGVRARLEPTTSQRASLADPNRQISTLWPQA